MDKILKCDHSNESYWVVLFCGTVYYAVQGGSNLSLTVDKILKCDHLNESYWVVLSSGTVYYADLSRSDTVYHVEQTVVLDIKRLF